MKTLRLAIATIVVGALVVAAYTLPLTTTANILGLDINVVVLFRAVLPFLTTGLLLELIANRVQDFIHGRLGKAIAETARTFVPAFLYMVPLEVAYIILFVAITLKWFPGVWEDNHFPFFFLPGLLALPFLFNSRALVVSIRSTWILIGDSWNWLWNKWLWALWYRLRKMKRIKPENLNPVPWGYLIADSLQLVWYGAFLATLSTFIIQVVQQGFNTASILILIFGFAAIIVIGVVLGALRLKYPPPLHRD